MSSSPSTRIDSKSFRMKLGGSFMSCVLSFGLVGSFSVCDVGFAQDLPKATRVDGPKPSIPSDKDGDWSSLFNGKDLSGWTQRNGWATYRIEGDAILGTTSEGSPNSFLCTNAEFGDFELRFEVKVDDPLNSGVQIRSKSLKEIDHGRVHGPQVEIEAAPGEAGFIYGEGTSRGWISPDQTAHSTFKNGEWNQYHIRAQGARMTTWINGKLIEDINDPASFEKGFEKGFIGLQVHGIGGGQGPFQVRWKNIFVRPIAPPSK